MEIGADSRGVLVGSARPPRMIGLGLCLVVSTVSLMVLRAIQGRDWLSANTISAGVTVVALIATLMVSPAPSVQTPPESECAKAVRELVAEAKLNRTAAPKVDQVRFAVTSTNGEVKERQLYLELGGRLGVQPPAGKRLYLILNADKDSRDAVGSQVNPNFYPRDAIQPDSDGCWRIARRPRGPPGGLDAVRPVR